MAFKNSALWASALLSMTVGNYAYAQTHDTLSQKDSCMVWVNQFCYSQDALDVGYPDSFTCLNYSMIECEGLGNQAPDVIPFPGWSPGGYFEGPVKKCFAAGDCTRFEPPKRD